MRVILASGREIQVILFSYLSLSLPSWSNDGKFPTLCSQRSPTRCWFLSWLPWQLERAGFGRLDFSHSWTRSRILSGMSIFFCKSYRSLNIHISLQCARQPGHISSLLRFSHTSAGFLSIAVRNEATYKTVSFRAHRSGITTMIHMHYAQ